MPSADSANAESAEGMSDSQLLKYARRQTQKDTKYLMLLYIRIEGVFHQRVYFFFFQMPVSCLNSSWHTARVDL